MNGLTPPTLAITLDLLQECDANTQKLMGLQAWVDLALKPEGETP